MMRHERRERATAAKRALMPMPRRLLFDAMRLFYSARAERRALPTMPACYAASDVRCFILRRCACC